MRYRRSTFRRRSARRTQFYWVRSAQNNATPAAVNNEDLLANWRTGVGFNLIFPEITIWRIHIRISARFSFTAPLVSNNGIQTALWTDSKNQVQLAATTNQYDQHWLMYDILYGNESFEGGETGTVANLSRSYDIKSKRALKDPADTLFLQLAAVGPGTIILDYSFIQSVLIGVRR